MTPHEILIAAKAKIDKPQKWSRGAAVGRLCAREAIYLASLQANRKGCDWLTLQRASVAALKAAMSGVDPMMFNDRRRTTHADVMAAFDRAIKATA